jgi:hypothetical protein
VAKTSKHRGFITSWPQFGGPAGLFLANMALLIGSAIAGDAGKFSPSQPNILPAYFPRT